MAGEGARVNAVVFSSDGTSLATASDACTCQVWDVATGKERVSLVHAGRVAGAAFLGAAPGGGATPPAPQLIATASADRTLRIWDAATGAPAGVFPVERALTAVAWVPPSLSGGTGRVATGDDRGTVYVLDRRG